MQQEDYYPFGLEINTITASPKNEYLYNKKELQEETQQYDYGARFYDPVIGRWGTIDPLAEISKRWSIYNYVMDNPVRLIDPDGMHFDEANDKKAHQLQNDIATKRESNKAEIAKTKSTISANTQKLVKMAIAIGLNGGATKSELKQMSNLSNAIESGERHIDDVQQENDYLKKSNDDIEALRGDDAHDYSFGEPSGDDGRHYVLGDNGSRAVTIEGSSGGLYIHEIRHIGQSMAAGGLQFKEGKLKNTGTTEGPQTVKEVDAYRAQYSFSGTFPGGAKTINDINYKSVKGLSDDNHEPIY